MTGEWFSCSLAEACASIDYGFTAAAASHDKGPKFLRITDIVSGHIDWNSVPHVEADEASIAKYQLRDGDIVLARTGASTGASAYVRNPPQAVFASYLVRLQAKPSFDPRFLSYYLKSDAFWHFIRAVLGDKSAQPNASASTMTRAPLRAPQSKYEQRAIAQILGTLDDKIELNRQMNETLEAVARAIFKSWFVDFEPVRGKASGEPPESICRRLRLTPDLLALFPDRLVDSELGEIPEGWVVCTLGDVIDIFDSKRVPLSNREREKRKGPYPYYGAASVMDSVDDFLFDGIYVLMGEDGSVVNADGTPVLQYVWGKFWVNNHAHVLQARPPISDEQLLLLLSRTNIASLVTGAVQAKLSQGNLRRIEFTRAPDQINEIFGTLVGPIFKLIRSRTEESRILAHTRDALLPELLSGRVRVPFEGAA